MVLQSTRKSRAASSHCFVTYTGVPTTLGPLRSAVLPESPRLEGEAEAQEGCGCPAALPPVTGNHGARGRDTL